MMQHAKLMSSAGLVSAKQEINDAVSGLEARPTCIQSVYTNLSRVFNALADHPQAQLAVDSTLATQTRVRLLSELVQIHLRDEEVQWALGRVISLACQVSTRFQCQAGQLEMWNELFAMRSTHPQSIRVQEASLRASEALFRSNEFHITKLRPRQHLDDLVDVMDRFLRIETPRRRAQALVVLALRVLVALYSSPRSAGLMLLSGESPMQGEKWMRKISRCMLDSFSIFNRQVESIRLWLEMVLLLLRHFPFKATETLFSPVPRSEITWWFVAVIENWQFQAEMMSRLLASLTFLFALPYKTLEDKMQICLAEKLICEQNLLNLLCSIIDHYHHASRVTSSTEHETVMLVLLETIRVVRQWSERPSLVPRFEASHSVKDTLLPLLIETLKMQSKQSSVIVLEILLVFRNLAASHSLRSVLAGFESLQTSLKWLRYGGTARTSLSAAGDAHDDGNLDALVAREARSVHKLVVACLGGAEPKTRNGSAIIVAKVAIVATRRHLRTEHVKPETLRVYGCKR
ncbi:hypothetical protein PC118_g17812 [Phytophthora cactorum]|uniref:Uncharacterized protein n=1 Tax=Phytophthora cactorum TaxID=29920 RepID=A0A8T1B881_9STRA|nr:hypothetical protein PC111_g17101 [Phytophthora cactorum]KAG2851442.1 hypothetical protein PC113_g15906 [Phytophthora cactorum]KAG2896141.1 hypothetical protein PC115_g17592 [Phytophthora cactorum]KAG2968784.1 hypothetical protein PC118_g17812 [Phytophthora cactorum]KAG2989716.1 hypothetical protein PC119_g19249 [Phytophthora cactorum]